MLADFVGSPLLFWENIVYHVVEMTPTHLQARSCAVRARAAVSLIEPNSAVRYGGVIEILRYVRVPLVQERFHHGLDIRGF